MPDPLIFHGPIEIEVKVAVTDGTNVGEAAVTAKRGHYASPAEIKASVDQALMELPNGYRPMTKREWFDHVFGMRVAMPGSDDWDELDEAE